MQRRPIWEVSVFGLAALAGSVLVSWVSLAWAQVPDKPAQQAAPPADQKAAPADQKAAPADQKAAPAEQKAAKPAQPAAAPAAAPPAKPAPQPNRVPGMRGRLGNRRIGPCGRVFINPPPNPGADDESIDELEGLSFPENRAMVQRLLKSKELSKDERYAEGVTLLGGILEANEDFFFRPDPEQPNYSSLKAEARRILGGMPSKGRETYELQFGARARKMLDEAVAAGNPAQVAEVSRKFFHTAAGYEATHLLGRIAIDEGQPLAAALYFERLQATKDAAQRFEPELSLRMATCWQLAGMPDKAQAALEALKKRDPGAQVVVGGQKRPVFGDRPILATLASGRGLADRELTAQWTMQRGNPARNATSTGSSPLLNRRWAVPTSYDTYVTKLVEQIHRGYLDQGTAAIPASQPLAVNGYVFVRTLTGLVAIDFATGKRIWTGAADESVRQVLEPDGQFAQYRNSANLNGWLDQRVWSDNTFGAMSSDGESIFCVEDLGIELGTFQQRQVVLANGRRLPQSSGPRSFNRLAAYEIATEGKLRWDVGSQPGEGQLELAGTFFLGPPLPLGGMLYVLAEVKGEIRLLALDAKTGRQLWSQQLALLERDIAQDPLRRTAGLSPSYADGVLVCPTSSGAVVGVDLTSRSLLWAFRYPRITREPPNYRLLAMGMAGPTDSAGEDHDHWVDATITLSRGKVLLTPPESNKLFVLDLFTGAQSWEQDRLDGLYLGCVKDDHVLVVGKNTLRGYALASGKELFTPQLFNEGTTPSGRGYLSDNQLYYLPLSSAEVAAIDPSTGQIKGTARARHGSVPGNLICFEGSIISQGIGEVECFYERGMLRAQVLAQLDKTPDNAQALASYGELLLDEGKLGESVDRLRKSNKLEPSQRTTSTLFDALVEGLRTDFAKFRGNIDETEQLVQTPAQRIEFLRVVADGYDKSHEFGAAFETYAKVFSVPAGDEALERLDNTRAVRRDRWLRAKLVELREHANAQAKDASAIDQAISARAQAAMQSAGVDKLREYLSYFGWHQDSELIREELAKRLAPLGNILESEIEWRQLEQSADPARQKRAVASLAKLLCDAGRGADASSYIDKLSKDFADVEVLDGKTGKQLVTELKTGSVATALGTPWPVGKVNVKEENKQPVANVPRSFPLEIRGSSGPYYSESTIEFDQQTQSLVARDGWGRDRWRVSMIDSEQRGGPPFGPTWTHARLEGHLALVSMGYEIVAVDTLGTPGKEPARILWRQESTDAGSGYQRSFNIHGRMILLPGGRQRALAEDLAGRPVGNTGPLTPSMVCFQRLRNLTAVAPLTGKTLWVRYAVPIGSDLFGDDQRLFVAAPGADEALVLSAIDGEELGRRPVPALDQRMATFGGKVLAWSEVTGVPFVRMVDVWSKTDLWRRNFEKGSKAYCIRNEALAVLEPSGNFQIIDLPSGKVTTQAKVSPEPSLNDIYVVRSRTSDVLFTNRPAQNKASENVQGIPGGGDNPVINGAAYGFDRATGKQIFGPRELKNQGLLLGQPSELPILVFASQIWEATGRQNSTKTQIAVLDKRNGRLVYDKRAPNSVGTFSSSGDPDKKEVLVRAHTTLKLSFTDEPLPAEEAPPAKSSSSTSGSNPAKSVFEGLIKIAEGLGTVPPKPRTGVPKKPDAQPAAPPEKKAETDEDRAVKKAEAKLEAVKKAATEAAKQTEKNAKPAEPNAPAPPSK